MHIIYAQTNKKEDCMSNRLSAKTKAIRKMGQGTGADYKPYITTSEFNSHGTTSVIKDWKTGRAVHCLSQGEMYWYYILRWDDTNIDVREQYPLDFTETVNMANKMGFSPPREIMTTDMLVTKKNGIEVAYSVKSDKQLSKRQMQLLCIEKQYWLNQGTKCQLVFKSEMNTILASNIRLVTEFYDAALVFDVVSAIKHKIAIKEIEFDMDSKYIENSDLMKLLEVKNE